MPNRTVDELVLVYDADSGLLAAARDSLKKLFSLPGCTLCSVTHGVFGARPEWLAVARSLAVPVREYHRDDLPFPLRQLVQGSFPCVLVRSQGDALVLLDRDTIHDFRGGAADFLALLVAAARRHAWDFPLPPADATAPHP